MFNLRAVTETGKRNPTEAMHAIRREEGFSNLVRQRDSEKQGRKPLLRCRKTVPPICQQ